MAVLVVGDVRPPSRAGALIVGLQQREMGHEAVGGGTVTSFLMLSPPTALAMGALFLDEPLTLAAIAGMVVVGLGLWVIMRPRRVMAGRKDQAGRTRVDTDGNSDHVPYRDADALGPPRARRG
ncbi:MAG: DMT family transporter [Chloroflexia bacterium]|nr:DMT family transporter [Chloroflexia bacterium]